MAKKISKAALERHLKRSTSAQGRMMDGMKVAKKVFPANITAAQAARWKKSPNRCDIEGIDAPKGTANVKSAEKTPEKPDAGKKPVKKVTKDTKKAEPRKTEKKPVARKPPERFMPESEEDRKATVHDSRILMARMLPRKRDDAVIEDQRAYLKDSAYGEVARNSRWRYDDDAAMSAYSKKMWDVQRTYYGGYRKRATQPRDRKGRFKKAGK